MWIGAWQARAKFTFLAGFRTASGTPYRQRLLLGYFHTHVVHAYFASARWSILISASKNRLSGRNLTPVAGPDTPKRGDALGHQNLRATSEF